MRYSEVGNWDTHIEVPNADEIRYIYVVLNDFQLNGGIPMWEPRTDRILAREQRETNDLWGRGPKLHTVQIHGLEHPVWRCPMPFSHLFDPQGEAYQEIKDAHIDTIVCLAHRGECSYNTDRELFDLYMQDHFELLVYSIDDYCVPSNMGKFKEFVDMVHNKIQVGKRCVVHCHSGTGRTGLFLACLAKKCSNTPVPLIIERFRDSLHGAIQSPAQIAFINAFPAQ